MSLQTAASGWGIISKNNNLYFTMDWVGTVYIGMDFVDLNEGLKMYSKIALRPKRDNSNSKRVCYNNNNGEEVFSVMMSNNVVHRLRYNGLVSKIPQNIIYHVGKKKFITNNRIDGYMLAIKDDNEVYLKEDKVVDAVDINSESLGVVKKTFTKKQAEENFCSWLQLFGTKDVYNADMYKYSQVDVHNLENEYRESISKLRQLIAQKNSLVKLLDKRCSLTSLQNEEKKLIESCNSVKQSYNRLADSYKDDIISLIKAGKLRNEDGFIYLNRNSDNSKSIRKTRRVPVYKDEVVTYEPSIMCHEDYEQYLGRRRRETTHSTKRVFVGYEDEVYYDEVEDTEFSKAEIIANKVKPLIDKYRSLIDKLSSIQGNIKVESNKLSAFMQTNEYKNCLTTIDNLDKEISILSGKVDTIKKRLYG